MNRILRTEEFVSYRKKNNIIETDKNWSFRLKFVNLKRGRDELFFFNSFMIISNILPIIQGNINWSDLQQLSDQFRNSEVISFDRMRK